MVEQGKAFLRGAAGDGGDGGWVFLFGRAASFRPTKIFSLIFLEELGKIARREGLFYWGAHKQLVARVWGKIFENARERDLFT